MSTLNAVFNAVCSKYIGLAMTSHAMHTCAMAHSSYGSDLSTYLSCPEGIRHSRQELITILLKQLNCLHTGSAEVVSNSRHDLHFKVYLLAR